MVHTYAEMVMMELWMSVLQSPKILQLYPGLAPIPELEPNFYDPVSNVEWSGIQDGDFPSDPSGHSRLRVPAKPTQKGDSKISLSHKNRLLDTFTWTTSQAPDSSRSHQLHFTAEETQVHLTDWTFSQLRHAKLGSEPCLTS